MVWIEIFSPVAISLIYRCHHWCSGVDWNSMTGRGSWRLWKSPLMQWCGLKSITGMWFLNSHQSPLMQWCGLKLCFPLLRFCNGPVTTDAVVWIEITNAGRIPGRITSHHWCSGVDWNPDTAPSEWGDIVTTDAVVWIEILIVDNLNHLPSRPPLIQ